MTKVAVVLSGCGYLDGAEVRESVLTLLYLDQQGAEVSMFAPDIAQHHVVGHLSGEPVQAERNVLEESARIARGKVQPLSKLDANVFEALLLPGGFGAAKNLSDIAMKGADATVLPALQDIIEAFYAQQKPIGAMCIAPAVVAAALKSKGITLTIGDDADTASVIESLGHKHKACPSHEAVIDHAHRVVTCSAYMREDPLAPIAQGIEKAVRAVMQMSQTQTEAKVS